MSFNPKEIKPFKQSYYIVEKFLAKTRLYEFFKLYITGIIEGALTTRAGAISFSLFMAIFPFLLFLLNLIPFIPIDNFQEQFILLIDQVMPSSELSQLITSIFSDIANNKRGGLLSSVFFLSLLLASNGLNAILSSFEHSYHTSESRTIIKQYTISVSVTLMLTILLITILCMAILSEYYLITAEKEMKLDWISRWAPYVRYFFLVLLIYLSSAILYYFGTKEKMSFNLFSKGASITTLLIILTTYLFGIYINNFNNYNELYGSIGAIMILMLYIWINSNIFLLGFDVNASFYKLRADKKRQATKASN